MSLTRLSANQLLIQAFVYPPLQHLFNLFSTVVIKTLKTQLLTGLFASDKFALYSQSPISNLFTAIIANFLSPYSFLSKQKQMYFFSRYLRSLTLLLQKVKKPIFLEKVSSIPWTKVVMVEVTLSLSSFHASSKQKASYSSIYFSRYCLIIFFFSCQSVSSLYDSISLNFLRISCLGFLANLSIVQLQSTIDKSIVDCLYYSVSLKLQSLDLDFMAQWLQIDEDMVIPWSYQSSSREDQLSDPFYSIQLLCYQSCSIILQSQESSLNICRLKDDLQSYLFPFFFLAIDLFSMSLDTPESRIKSSKKSFISGEMRVVERGVIKK